MSKLLKEVRAAEARIAAVEMCETTHGRARLRERLRKIVRGLLSCFSSPVRIGRVRAGYPLGCDRLNTSGEGEKKIAGHFAVSGYSNNQSSGPKRVATNRF